MDELHNYKRNPRSNNIELLLMSLTLIFGICLLIYGFVVFIGGPAFMESLGGINTLVALIFGTFIFGALTVAYKSNTY
jgi:uncharacterized membrane protein